MSRTKAMLSDEQVTSFQALYKKQFGREIGKEEALEKGAKLVRMMQLIYKPMTKEECEKVQKRRNEQK